MELTAKNFGFKNLLGIIKIGVLPLGILAVVAMMVLPLPAFLLDLFFVTNILVSLLVLMVAMHTYRPLDFSSFPSLLLIATVLRLALNVASTRVVLADGHTGSDSAGKVIEAFGKTKDNQSVYLKINNFTPYFYVEIPKRWQDMHIKKFLNYIKGKTYGKLQNSIIT